VRRHPRIREHGKSWLDAAGLITFGGGVPIKLGDRVVGSIGVAGRRVPRSTKHARWQASRN
jgi:uncharacterized protein GlcG (DUF336 family)